MRWKIREFKRGLTGSVSYHNRLELTLGNDGGTAINSSMSPHFPGVLFGTGAQSTLDFMGHMGRTTSLSSRRSEASMALSITVMLFSDAGDNRDDSLIRRKNKISPWRCGFDFLLIYCACRKSGHFPEKNQKISVQTI